MFNICIFGDSIAWGFYDPIGGGWVTRLKNYYMKCSDVCVYNLGISGASTETLLRRLETEIKSRNPEIIIFAIGINDSYWVHSKKGYFVTLDKFKANLRKIYDISSKFSNKIIFIGLNDITETLLDPWDDNISYKEEATMKYEEVLKNFCKRKKIQFIDTREFLDKKDLHDGLHPNTEGHIKIFNRVRDLLMPYINK